MSETQDATSEWGRVADDGTVFVRTSEGERVVGSWQAGEPAEGLAFFRRKYEALASEVTLLGQRLKAGAGDPVATAAALNKLAAAVPTAAAVGDLEGLAKRIADMQDQVAAKVEERKAKKAEANAAAVARKTALAEEAERLAETSDWKSAGDRIRAIGEEWKTIRIDRTTDAELWKRYRTARDGFTRRRGAHFAQLDEQRKEFAAAKEKLVAEAETLATSTEWGATAKRFKDLMVEWKTAGRAPKDVDEKLWARFKTAQDAFFTARHATFSERDAEQQGNAAAKEAIIVEAERLSLDDPAAAQSRLRDIQDRYDKAGKVPRELMGAFDERMRRAEQRVRDAVDAKWKTARPSSSPMVIRLEESIAKLEKRLERAQAAGDAGLVAETEAALATQREWLAQAD
ncbi:MAG: hypothetical protein QOK42_1056 [Frankiaceae bacterium]|nr:hypothetical protein [Frankiaceae bacterium]MDX6272838.1 hypothetical protein [Frankiales bacterium]